MLTIKRLRGGDVAAELRCCVCRQSLSMRTAWLGFAPPQEGQPSPTQWLHRGCLNGNAEHVFKSRHVTLWRGADVLEHLLRATEGGGTA